MKVEEEQLSCLDPEKSTRGNRRVPLSRYQFSRLHLRTRKTYDILVRLENNSLPIFIKMHIYIKILLKIR